MFTSMSLSKVFASGRPTLPILAWKARRRSLVDKEKRTKALQSKEQRTVVLN